MLPPPGSCHHLSRPGHARPAAGRRRLSLLCSRGGIAHGVPGGGGMAHCVSGDGSPSRIFARPVTTASRLPDGSTVLRSGIPLEPYAPSMAAMFRAAAMAHPGRTLAAQREAAAAGGWRTVTYGAARRQVDGLAQGL